jgi:hypothetical protein
MFSNMLAPRSAERSTFARSLEQVEDLLRTAFHAVHKVCLIGLRKLHGNPSGLSSHNRLFFPEGLGYDQPESLSE